MFTLEQKGAMSRAFDAGNYANAYESTDLEDFKVDEMPENERAAFVLGFDTTTNTTVSASTTVTVQ